MARYRKTWVAKILGNALVNLTHQYSDDGTATGASYRVRVMLELADGPQKGREVDVWMTATEARAYGESLIRAASVAGEENEKSGYRDE